MRAQTIILVGESQRALALRRLESIPVGATPLLEVVFREHKDARSLDQNAAMWAGPLRDIAEQAWVNRQQFSAEAWHEHFKREFLPEDDDPEIDELVKDGYRKWTILPTGDRVLTGSTTQLTRKGMARYMQQIEAFGARMGVLFHAAPGAGNDG